MNRPKSWDAIAAFEAMLHDEKARHWAGEAPWTFKGKVVRLPQVREIDPSKVLVEPSTGNIRRMPELGGRPCFGQVTAFVRHGEWKHRFIRGRPLKTRCMRCNVREACKKVARARIKSSKEIDDAHAAFVGHGGVHGLENPREFGRAQSYWSRFVQTVVAHGPWTSSNDSHARSWVDAQIANQRRRDRERKVVERRRRIRAGEPDPEFIVGMRAQAMHRAILLKQTLGNPNAPRCIRQLPPSMAMITADVWLADRLLHVRGANRNPSSIATLMINLGYHHGKAHNPLRQRVESDLRRIRVLEAPSPDGSPPVWPPFSLEDALPHVI